MNQTQVEVQERLAPLEDAIFYLDCENSEKFETFCYSGTRVNLLERIKGWITSTEGKNIFWLQGMAGTGKSTVSRTTIRDLDEEIQCIANFYFKRNTDCADSAQLFPTIAAQLNRRLPSISGHIKKNLYNLGDKPKPSVVRWSREKQLRKLILEPLKKIDDPERPWILVLIIDALDECDDQENMKMILRLLPGLEQLQSIKVKFLLTSRSESHIRAAMEKLDHQKVTPLDEEPATTDDISVVVRSRLKEIQAEFNLKTTWPGEDKIEKLVNLTQPLFISAVTACLFIRDQRISGTEDERLEKILKQERFDYNNTIAGIYLTILEQMIPGPISVDREGSIAELKEILGAIIISFRHLSADSLANVLDNNLPDNKLKIVNKVLKSLHSVLRVPSDKNLPITLFHQSFRDFLLDPNLAKEFLIEERKFHEMLHSKCLDKMINYLKEDLCSQKRPGTCREDVDDEVIDRYLKPELRYACLYWVEHLQKSSPKVDDIDRVHHFLKKHFLHWLEALGWMGKFPNGIQSIINLELVVRVGLGYLVKEPD